MLHIQDAFSVIPNLKYIPAYPAARMTTFGIGGEVAHTVFPQTTDALLHAVACARKNGYPYRVIGRGSNILARDEGYDGVWIVTRDCTACRFPENRVEASCGLSLSALIELCAARNLGGLENLYGIPGTVGGAVTMNAGAFGTAFSDLTVAVDAYDTETGVRVSIPYHLCGFGYRESVFQQNRYVICSVTLRPGNSREDLIRARMSRVTELRRASQPLSYPSAGSVFKRPVNGFAGRLIQEAGCAGLTVGGAQVSEKHAGFIINRGRATAHDVGVLMETVRQRVYQNSGVLLVPELIKE